MTPATRSIVIGVNKFVTVSEMFFSGDYDGIADIIMCSMDSTVAITKWTPDLKQVNIWRQWDIYMYWPHVWAIVEIKEANM